MTIMQIAITLLGALMLGLLVFSGKKKPGVDPEAQLAKVRSKNEQDAELERQASARIAELEERLFKEHFAPRGVPETQKSAALELFRVQAQAVDDRHYVRIIESQMRMDAAKAV